MNKLKTMLQKIKQKKANWRKMKIIGEIMMKNIKKKKRKLCHKCKSIISCKPMKCLHYNNERLYIYKINKLNEKIIRLYHY